jgi:hypothetical protein
MHNSVNFPLAPISFLVDRVPASDKCYLSDDSGIVIDTSSLFTGPGVEQKLLNEALKANRRRTAFEQIVTEYPSLQIAALNMVIYLTQLTPADGGMTMLSKCLTNGIDEFNRAHRKAYMSNDPAIKMSAFILGASSHFHEILLNNIYGRYEDSWVQWKPLTEPIFMWIQRFQFQKLLIVPTSDKITAESCNAASNKLLYEVFNFADLSFCGISTVGRVKLS